MIELNQRQDAMHRPWLVALLATLLVSPPAFADGIDVVPYLARVGHGRSVIGIIGLVSLWMLMNYALNLVVIGGPAVKLGPATVRSVATGMVLLTLLGQVADRLGAIVAVIAMVPLPIEFGGMVFVSLLLGLNFLFSDVAVGFLALYFLRRRWHVLPRPAWAIAGVAAILTNPAWAIYLLPLFGAL